MIRIWFGYLDLCARTDRWARAYRARYNGYQGRHRTEATPGRFVGWREAQRNRVAAWLAAHAEPVIEEPAPDWAYPELHPDPHEITVPMTPPMYPKYGQLKPRVMDAQARIDRRTIVLRSSTYGTPETADEWEPEPALVGVR